MKSFVPMPSGLTEAQYCSMKNQGMLRSQVNTICCHAGVVPMKIMWYYNLAQQVNKKAQQGKFGEVLALETGSLVEVYTRRGLRRDVLLRIASGIFSIDVE